MDEARATLISVLSSLAKLQLRLLKLSHSSRTMPTGHITPPEKAFWGIRDIDPPSPWFDAADPNTSLSGAIKAVALVEAHLLAMIDAPGEIDRRLAVRIVEHLCRSAHWSERVLVLAKRLGVDLPDTPREFHHMAGLEQVRLPRRGERHRDS